MAGTQIIKAPVVVVIIQRKSGIVVRLGLVEIPNHLVVRHRIRFDFRTAERHPRRQIHFDIQIEGIRPSGIHNANLIYNLRVGQELQFRLQAVDQTGTDKERLTVRSRHILQGGRIIIIAQHVVSQFCAFRPVSIRITARSKLIVNRHIRVGSKIPQNPSQLITGNRGLNYENRRIRQIHDIAENSRAGKIT